MNSCHKRWLWFVFVLSCPYIIGVGSGRGDGVFQAGAPVIPVSTEDRAYAGNSVYLTFYVPKSDGRWHGNLKRYHFDPETGRIDGIDPVTGKIGSSTRSAWSDTIDGANVLAGGAGAELLKRVHLRKIVTLLGVTDTLMDVTNRFAVGNTTLTADLLGTETGIARQSLIEDVIGTGRHFAADASPWILGDILHSAPAVARLEGQTYIFVGANDGMLHCFSDIDGSEVWGFIPDDLFPKLKRLSDDIPAHEYFVDGTPSVFSSGDRQILIFGEGRGGVCYHAIDVTDPRSPVHQFKLGANLFGKDLEKLGQSWGRPLVGFIRTRLGRTRKVIILPGGYDPNQDLRAPAAKDTRGRAIFAVDAGTGHTEGDLKFFHDNISNSDMTHSFVDVSGADTDGDGFIDRVYAGDMNGQVFAFRADDKTGTWEKRLLFKASEKGIHRKIFGAPDIVSISTPVGISGAPDVGEMIFFGTGDRAHPDDTRVTNRLYAIKNYWDKHASGMTVDTVIDGQDAFCDVTDDFTQQGARGVALEAVGCLGGDWNRGWYMNFESKGEQIVGSPVVYNGVVYFTTYTPLDGQSRTGRTDIDTSPGAVATGGTSRIYAMDARTATGLIEVDNSTVTPIHRPVLDKQRKRARVVSDTLLSEAMVVVFKSGAQVMAGGNGVLVKLDTATRSDLHMYYWRDMKN